MDFACSSAEGKSKLADSGVDELLEQPLRTNTGSSAGSQRRQPIEQTLLPAAQTNLRMQHTLYFLPLPHGHGSLRPIFLSARLRIGSFFFSLAWLVSPASCWLGAIWIFGAA